MTNDMFEAVARFAGSVYFLDWSLGLTPQALYWRLLRRLENLGRVMS